MNLLVQETYPCDISYDGDVLPRKRTIYRPNISQPDDPFVRLIPLTNGQITIVDTFLYDWLMQWNWFARWNFKTNSFYAVRWVPLTEGKCSAMLMHRHILGLPAFDPRQGDHQNRNTLDNRGSNLRIASPLLNAVNHRIQANNTSGFRGVYKRKKYDRWFAVARRDGKPFHVGEFRNPIDAAKARDIAVLREYGTNAVLNFPDQILDYKMQIENQRPVACHEQ